MSKDKSTNPAPVSTEQAPATKPAETTPAPAAPTATAPRRYQVSNSDGHSGIVEAASIDAAKYGFMRANGICDRGGMLWTITAL